ncbi:MAG: hypothetical protein HYX69_01550 [Planctomycetia bacterium]|nr:hypothetical protein [Planctomycetia bacterium]
MKFDEACVLLPCHSLEDFPTHHEGEAAEGLLAAWSGLWHPALLASCGRLPTWHRADSPPDALAGRLIVIPSTSEPQLLAGWASRAAAEGAHVVRKLYRRDDIVRAALAGLDGGDAVVDPELVADFLALGFCQLAVELLTRLMRYMSNIDEVHLQNEAVAAARACMAGDAETARTHLRNSFDVLVEARERFYPVDAFLVDLTLVAPSTIGASLAGQLRGDAPRNLMLAGETLARLAESEPETLAALRMALDHQAVTLVGGEREERELPLMPIEAVLAEFQSGADVFERALGMQPRVYGRRRFGLSPILPQILSRLGFTGAIHFTLDDGRFATASQSKVRWEGLDYTAIDALARLPLDAAAAGSFLGLPRTLGESMDRDHVATVVFAHWPGRTSVFYDDLRRISAYRHVLGKFVTLEDYFANTASPGELIKFKSDGYRSPYLRQAVTSKAPGPVSAVLDEHLRDARRHAIESLDAVADVLGAAPRACGGATQRGNETLEELDRRKASAAARVATTLGAECGTVDGLLLVNPHSFARRVVVDAAALSALPSIEGNVVAAQESSGRKLVVADIPGMAFCWLAPGAASPPPRKAPKPIAAETTLANEYLRVEIHPATGALHAIYGVGQRGNQLSAQLGLRFPPPRPKPGDIWRDPDEDAEYSAMQADAVEIAHAGPAVGEITSRGRLVDREGRRLAAYTQRFQLARGSRVVAIDIELAIEQEPAGDPWESYYAARFAWPDEAADLSRSVGMTIQATEARRLESPHLVLVRSPRSRAAILTGGLPYHRRSGARMLDTVLVVPGETRRRFRLAVGIDVAHPMQQALELLDPVAVVRAARPAGAGQANWLFHVDAKNVVATHWSALRDDAGRTTGFRVRLLETEGVAGGVRLRAVKDIENARCTDFRGQTLSELPVAGDCVTIDVAAFEWTQIEATWRG